MESTAAHPHETSLERQRRRPMWGCVKVILILIAVFIGILILVTGGGYYYVGTPSFARLIARRLEANLESHLGRDVSIGKVTIFRGRPIKVIIENLQVANAPGALRPHFATVRAIEITGGVESFRNRLIQLGYVEVRDPQIFFEVFPAGEKPAHNWPRWRPSPPRRYEITRLDINKMLLRGGSFYFNDRRHNIDALVTSLSADVDPAFRQGIYEGIALSRHARVRIKDYEPLDLALRGAFFYRPGSLSLRTVSFRGRGIEAFLQGTVDPLSDAVYDLRLTSKADLARVREIFRVARPLEGQLSLDGGLRGAREKFTLNSNFFLPELTADTYEVSDLRGLMRVTNERINVEVKSGTYGGGSLTANYELAKYAEPYPMSVDLRFDRVSIEKLFADWNMENTGLRGGASGSLHYQWNKDDLLSGTGQGSAALSRGAMAFGEARYPTPLAGQTRFALNRGVITFAPTTLSTDATDASFDGTLRLEDLVANLDVRLSTRDFAELDRIGYNFAHSTGKRDYELLGLAGSGHATTTVRGKIGEPTLVAHIAGTGVQYNNVALGGGEVDLRYDGPRGVLTFDRASFRDGEARIALAGTIAFPDRGPSPLMDLSIDASGWPVERALDMVNLELAASGTGTGKLRVEGTPESGQVNFDDLRIVKDDSRLRLNGLVAWAPGEGNLSFNLDIGAESYPAAEILAFLEMKNIPVTGALTGTLHLEGPKKTLEGAGNVTVRGGSVFGEPVDIAKADLVFTQGLLKATRVEVQAPAGTLLGEAEVDLANERFSYVIRSSELEVARLKAFQALNRFFGGRLRITSSGAGTFEQPEVVVEATLLDGTVRGTVLPADVPPPTLYFATREGRLVIRGSGFGAFSVTGDGTIAPDGTLEGTARIEVTDVARLLSLFAPAAEFPAAGSFVVDLELGGKLTPIEALDIRGTIPALDLQISEHRVTASEPIRFAMSNGRVELLSYKVVTDGSSFSADGFVSLVGNREINLQLRGLVEAAFIQLFAPDIRADGHLNIAAGVTGTVDSPRVEGTAEIRDAQVKFAGFPQLIDDITGTLVFRGDALELDALQASLGGGTVTAGGLIALDGLTPKSVRLRVEGTDVSIRYFEGVTVDGDVRLVLSGDVDRMALQGEVQVERAVYFKDVDFTSEILNLILDRENLLPEVAASWQDRVTLQVHVSAPGTIAIKNNLADITGSADFDLTGTLATPVILGAIDVDEGGKIRLQDKEYRVVRGTISFQNPVKTDPYFDLTAEARLSEYDVTINLTGTIDRIRPTITSDPPASSVTLFSLLGLGLPSAQGDGAGSDSLGGFTSTILVQGLGLVGSRILPFADAVRLEGLLDPTEPSVTFEKRINEDLRVIVTYYTESAQNRNVEVVEWQVTPDWVLQFTRDTETQNDVFINAVSARFRRRYEGRW